MMMVNKEIQIELRPNWNDGTMEYWKNGSWSIGKLARWVPAPPQAEPNISTFHYSIIPCLRIKNRRTK
jgi:hypothetical protein